MLSLRFIIIKENASVRDAGVLFFELLCICKGVDLPRRYNLSLDGFYHITHKAAGKDLLFYDDIDKIHFIGLLKKVTEEFSTKVCAFALMNNHVHILIKITEFDLSRPMKFLFQSYALYFNARHNREGCVFKGRFYSECIRNQLYLLICSLYIHLNPYKARISVTPYDYRWFSLIPFVSKVKKTFISFDEIIKIIDSKNIQRGQKIYCQLIDKNKQIRLTKVIKDNNAVEEFFRDFMLNLNDKFSILDAKYHFQIRDFESLEKEIDILKAAKNFKEIKNQERLKYIYVELKKRNYDMNQICKIISKGRTTVYRQLKSF